MSDITITSCTPVHVIEQFTGPAHEAVSAGNAVYLVAASGKFGLADENGSAPLNEPEGVAIKTALQQNDTITVVKKGYLDIGNGLTALNYGAPVYLSATAGALADADPGNAVLIGEVWPAFGSATADKLLRVDL